MSPPADAYNEALWTIHPVKAFDGSARPDPYFIWAELTHYRDFGTVAGGRLPVAIELKAGEHTAKSFASLIEQRGWGGWIWISSLYRDAPDSLATTRFCTAHVTREFFARAGTELATVIERFTLAAPVHAGGDYGGHAPIPDAPSREDIGKVIVGVCDDDIAFVHRRFFEDASGTSTRFHCFWNQDEASHTTAGLGYGSELLKPQMDARLQDAHAGKEKGVYRLADYAGIDSSLDDHGPHESPLPLIGVQFGNAHGALRDAAGLRLDVQTLDAIRYIVRRAQDTCGASCHALVNLSYGQLSGPRDGSSLIECALDELMDTGSCSVVMPSGNRHVSRCHGTVTIAHDTPLRWRVPPAYTAPSFVEIWFPAGMRDPQVDLCVAPPDGAPGTWIRRGECAVYSLDGDAICTVVHQGRSARGDGDMILIALAPRFVTDASRRAAAPGDWRILLRNRAADKVNAMYYCARHASVCHVT
jgi:hypothetical protein